MRRCMHVKVEGALLCAAALSVGAVQAGAVFERDKAGTSWQDGVLIGDGATAAARIPDSSSRRRGGTRTTRRC